MQNESDVQKSSVSTDGAPQAIGPYSQAIVSGDLVFCSGQVGLDPSTGELAGETIEEQARRGFENLSAVLSASGLTTSDVVKTTVFLVSMDDFAAMNEIYSEFFSEPFPARSTVAVAALPKGARFEVEAIGRVTGFTLPTSGA